MPPGRGATLKIPEPAATKQRFGFGRFKGGQRDSALVSPLVATLATVPLTESPVLPEVTNSSNRNSFLQLYATRTPSPRDVGGLSGLDARLQSRSAKSAGPPPQFPMPKSMKGQEPSVSEDTSRSESPPTRLSAYMERAIRRPSVLDLANLMPDDLPTMPSIPVNPSAKGPTVKVSKSVDELNSNDRQRTAASTKASRRSAVMRSHSASSSTSAIEIAGTLPHVTVRDGQIGRAHV